MAARDSTPAFCVIHQLPGRLRLRVPALSARAERLQQGLEDCALVRRVRLEPSCDSLVIEHRGDAARVLRIVQSALQPAARSKRTSRRVVESRRAHPEPAREGPGGALAWATTSMLLTALPATRLFAQLALFVSGLPIWHRALRVLARERRLNVDFLDGLALATTVVRRHLGTGALMAGLVHLGDWIRERTARRSRRKLRQLLDFQQVRARRFVDDRVLETVPASQLRAGDRVRVAAGDVVPADGRVLSGLATLDQRHMTGESLPVTIGEQDTLYAGSAVIEGALTFEVTAAAGQTQAARITRLVADAPLGDTRAQNYAERFADRLVAPLLGVNVLLLLATRNLDRFVSLAIVDYGTGIRVAAPTGVLAAMTSAARHGIVIRGGRQVEQLAHLRGMGFDKTGTLTRGRLAVVHVQAFLRSMPLASILQCAAAVEAHVRHPVARALVLHARDLPGSALGCADAKYTLGLGVTGTVAGHQVHVGSERYLRQQGVALARARTFARDADGAGDMPLLVAIDGTLAAGVRLADQLRADATGLVAGLRERGVRELVLITGDRRGPAQRIADALGIRRVHAEVLPHEKAELAAALTRDIGAFAMAGDGVNDAAALARAEVGISVFGGADIARTAADVVLLNDNLLDILRAIDLSREAMDGVQQNYRLLATANTLALALSLPGRGLSPLATTVLSNGSAMVALLKAARPMVA